MSFLDFRGGNFHSQVESLSINDEYLNMLWLLSRKNGFREDNFHRPVPDIQEAHQSNLYYQNQLRAQFTGQSLINPSSDSQVYFSRMYPLVGRFQPTFWSFGKHSSENDIIDQDPKAEMDEYLKGSNFQSFSELKRPSNENLSTDEDSSTYDGQSTTITSQGSFSEENHSKEKSDANAKKRNPKGLPRHPLNAYNFFFSDERIRILNDLTSVESKVQLACETKRLSDDEYMKDKLKQYSKQRSLKKSKKRVHRKTHGKISFKELASLIAKRWKKLSSEELSFYNKLAELDKANYRIALAKYKKERFIAGDKDAPTGTCI